MRTSISFDERDSVGRLYAECKAEERHFSRRLAEIVKRYERLCTAAMPQNLTRTEWLALIAANWSHAFDDIDFASNTLPFNVLDADLNELSPGDEQMDESQRELLVKKIRAFSKAEQFAVVDVLERLCGEEDGRLRDRFLTRHANGG